MARCQILNVTELTVAGIAWGIRILKIYIWIKNYKKRKCTRVFACMCVCVCEGEVPNPLSVVYWVFLQQEEPQNMGHTYFCSEVKTRVLIQSYFTFLGKNNKNECSVQKHSWHNRFSALWWLAGQSWELCESMLLMAVWQWVVCDAVFWLAVCAVQVRLSCALGRWTWTSPPGCGCWGTSSPPSTTQAPTAPARTHTAQGNF